MIETAVLLRCFDRYISDGGHSVTRAQFEANLHIKSTDSDFRDNIGPLLRPGIRWDFDEALKTVRARIIAALPGDPWKGDAT